MGVGRRETAASVVAVHASGKSGHASQSCWRERRELAAAMRVRPLVGGCGEFAMRFGETVATTWGDLKNLNPRQRSAVLASYLGWTLDAFDYFLLVFVLKDIAAEFHTDVTAVSVAIVLTLAARPIGALLFGY